ncbi:MAG: TetR/AcrR family transcriptional regulator [Porticoccaceae bacterium]|jgi:TetR/AcrR family transcriptional regulator
MTKKYKRNSALTIKVILDAAREEFIESGINKATIEKIADRADISQQLIYHYFGGKETLYQEMLADTARSDVERAESSSFDNLEPQEALANFIDMVFEGHDKWGRLVIDQIQQDGRQIIDSNPIRDSTRRYVSMLSAILDRGKRSGIFTLSIKNEDLFILIWLLSLGMSSFGPMASKYIDRDFVTEMANGYWRDYSKDFILKAIKP